MRDAGVVVTHPDVASPDLVLVCDSLDPLDQGVLGHRCIDQHVPVQLDVVGHRSICQLVQVSEAELNSLNVGSIEGKR